MSDIAWPASPRSDFLDTCAIALSVYSRQGPRQAAATDACCNICVSGRPNREKPPRLEHGGGSEKAMVGIRPGRSTSGPRPSALPRPLHANQRKLAELGGTLFAEVTQRCFRRGSHIGGTSIGERHARLFGQTQSRPEAIRVDCGSDPWQCGTILQANFYLKDTRITWHKPGSFSSPA